MAISEHFNSDQLGSLIVNVEGSWWVRFETLVCPEILFGCFSHALFDEFIHPARRSDDIVAGVILPGWIKSGFPALIIR